MRILAIGDVIGAPGRTYLKDNLQNIKNEFNIDFIIANGENSSGGLGMNPKAFSELTGAGVNAITLGNHTWRKKDILKVIDDTRVIRPINYLDGTAGRGFRFFNVNGKRILIINAVGRVYMEPVNNPFLAVRSAINEMADKADIIIVDFHAEATSEKKAMGYLLDGKVNLVFGTHTHVQTGDEVILPKGMQIGKTYDDLVDCYGFPSSFELHNDSATYTYSSNDYNVSFEMKGDFITGIIISDESRLVTEESIEEYISK